MDMNMLLYLGLTMVIAFAIKYLFTRVKLPEVTGYVLIGIVFGVSILHFYTPVVLNNMESVTTIALGLIAFLIGTELKLSRIKKLGKSIIFIVLFESLGAFTVVFTAMFFLFHGNLSFPLILGSVAAATAPAATVAVIRQFKAKGDLTTTILAVVGIDDAIALIIYAFASSFTKAIIGGQVVNVVSIFGFAFLSVLISVSLGIVAALVFVFILRKIKVNDMVLVLLAAFILLLLGISTELHVSELLAIMSFGAVVANMSQTLSMKSEELVQYFSPIFIAAFFIFGGAHLDVTLIAKIGLIGGVFFLARSFGKIGGGSLGAIIGNASPTVKKYVGFALLPQVGVALALALSVKKTFDVARYGSVGHELSVMVINVLLLTTIFTEIIGPFLTKTVLTKAGEIEKKA